MTDSSDKLHENLTADKRLMLNDDACYKIVEGEALILDIPSGEYFNLNQTATEILERAASGKTVAEIISEMKNIYAQSAEDTETNAIESDVRELIHALMDKNILLASA